MTKLHACRLRLYFVLLLIGWQLFYCKSSNEQGDDSEKQCVIRDQNGSCEATTNDRRKLMEASGVDPKAIQCENQEADESCNYWSYIGECYRNPEFMIPKCKSSCASCALSEEEAIKFFKDSWVALQQQYQQQLQENGGEGQVQFTPEMYASLVQQQQQQQFQNENLSYGAELPKVNQQTTDDAATAANNDSKLSETKYGAKQLVKIQNGSPVELQKIVKEMEDYMEKIVFVDPKFENVRHMCKNRNEGCAFWKSLGECEKSQAYMTVECAPMCHSCHQIDFGTRCPYNASVPTIWNENDLDRMFLQLVDLQQYEPNILSMPETMLPKFSSNNNDIQEGPWVVTLDKFLTNEECDHLIELGANQGYKRSMDIGKRKYDGSFDGKISQDRTSENAWCAEKCAEDPIIQQVTNRISNITGVPSPNAEYLQLLRYEVGQYYVTHHDYVDHQVDRQEGVRILTVYLYLNDVEQGGGTNFPMLGLTVMPKKGRALVWPSVLNEDPNAKDQRTLHQALAVEKGIKFGANAWIHQRDFKEAHKRGCH